MKPVKVAAHKFEGYAITVDVKGDIDEYAKSFLHIFNNVRENKDLLKVRNYYDDNCVTVYCNIEAKEHLIKYLKTFGEIKYCEKVLVYQMEEPDYDIDKYYDVISVTDFI